MYGMYVFAQIFDVTQPNKPAADRRCVSCIVSLLGRQAEHACHFVALERLIHMIHMYVI